jgi:hypothetical protein
MNCLLVTSAHREPKWLKIRPYLFQAVRQLQQRDTTVIIQYCHLFRRFVREGAHVQYSGLRFKRDSLCLKIAMSSFFPIPSSSRI